MTAQDAIEQAARDSWSRLLAYLAVRSRDLAASEDALADAFHAALEWWPRTGIPDRPEAWLLTAARRKLIDQARHAQVHDLAVPALRAVAEEAQHMAETEFFPDERLKLLFICAHPAIDEASRTPLMLQTVLGLDAVRIASAFLVRHSAMGQRLTRAKAKIRDAGIRFELPGPDQLAPRLNAVLEAVYAAYGSAWEDDRKGLATEAVRLGRLLLQLLPGEPEVKGLLALMLHCEARRSARRTSAGDYVPLAEQNTAHWSPALIVEAERLLGEAARETRMGRFQLEAAIQSVHAQRAQTGRSDWESIALLYEGLVRFAPTIGANIGRIAAVAEARGPSLAWSLLTEIHAEGVTAYQPYWALRAHLLGKLGRPEEAREAYDRAIGLCEDPAMRRFLQTAQAARNRPPVV